MPTNKPEVVLPEAPPIPAHLFDKDQSIVWAAAWETLRKHVADTLTRPADGEFHECPHCKGWSRTSAQHPAEAVALTYDQLFWAISAGVRKVGSDGSKHVSVSAFKEALGIDKSDSLYTIPKPPAIDIGKLRELAKWMRTQAVCGAIGVTQPVTESTVRTWADTIDSALIGDGGEKGNG